MIFGDLSPEGKIKAILAVAREPITKELTLAFAGVKMDVLSDEERRKVEGLFTSTAQKDSGGKELYKIEESDNLFKELGIESNEADRAITEYYMRQMREGTGLFGSKV